MNTDRFNHTVDRKVKTEATRCQRVEGNTSVEHCREWTDEKKLAIITESCQDGGAISDVARRHGLRPQQLFIWRSEFRKRNAGKLPCDLPSAADRGVETPAFVPVVLSNDRPLEAPPVEAPQKATTDTASALIEIVLDGATIRLHGAIEDKALASVLRAVRSVA
jgi:transposase